MPIFLGSPYKGPCVVEVRSAGYEPPKCYGPFPSIRESKTWMNIQYEQGFTGTFSIYPICTPYRVRRYDDWWMSQVNRKEEDRIADVPSKPWFKLLKWRKWLRKTSPLYYKAYMNKPVDFDDLPEKIRLKYIAVAFQSLCDDDQVPYEIQTGDYDTWDNYGPAIELARSNYEEDINLES